MRVITEITCCPRCTCIHKNLKITRMATPIFQFQYFAICPNLQEPMLFKRLSSSDMVVDENNLGQVIKED